MKATQERLGHSTSRMTMEVYSHATAAMQDHADVPFEYRIVAKRFGVDAPRLPMSAATHALRPRRTTSTRRPH